jgi:hypothetical protein
MAIENFFASLGYEIKITKVDELKTKFDALRESMLKVGTAATQAATYVGGFVTQVAAGLDDIGNFADLNHLSVQALQEIAYAAKANGASLDAVKTSVAAVNRVINEASQGMGRGAITLQELGLSAKNADCSVKSFDQLLGDVANKMQGLSRQEQIAMAKKLGIDSALVPMLAKGSAAIADLRSEARGLGVANEENAKIAGNLSESLNHTKAVLTGMAESLAAGLMPEVTRILDSLREWVVANKDIIRSSIGGALKIVTAIIGTMWDWVVRIVDGLIDAYDWLSKFEGVTWLAGAAITALIAYKVGVFFTDLGAAVLKASNALFTFNFAAMLPAILLGLIIICVVLLVDELVNFYEGNETIIGQLNKEFPGAIYGAWAALFLLGAGFVALKWKAISSMLETMAIMGLYALDYVKLAGKAAKSFATMARGWISAAATALANGARMAMAWVSAAGTALASGARMAMAWIIGMGPIGWVIAAVIAAAGLIWYYWDELSAWLGQAWDIAMQFIKDGTDKAVTWVTGLFDDAKKKVMGFIDTVVGAIGKVGQLLGLTDDASTVKIAVSSSASAGANAGAHAGGSAGSNPGSNLGSNAVNPLNAKGGVIGAAGSNTSNSNQTTNMTTISGTTITVNSPDPAKAGQAVQNALSRVTKQATRNGQSPVAQ